MRRSNKTQGKFILQLKARQMSKQIDQRLRQFHKSIRKQQIQTMKQTTRRMLLKKHMTANDLTSIFNIQDFHPSKKPYLKILQNCQDILLNPFSKSISTANYQSPQKQFTVETHINFWKQFIYDIQDHIKQTAPLLRQFALKLTQKYSCSYLLQSPQFSIEFMNILYELSPYLTRIQKDKVLEWVRSTMFLVVIEEYVNYTQFISYKQYPNIYDILKKGLKDKNIYESTLSAKILVKMLKYADNSSIYQIYEHQIQIPYLIIDIIRQRCFQFEVTDFWMALLFILNTFDDGIIAYASIGIIPICGCMIKSQIDSNIFGALQILRLFSEIRSKIIAERLIVDEQLQSSTVWLSVCLQIGIHRYSNIQIRRSFFYIIKNLITSLGQRQVHIFCSGFAYEDRNIFDCFEEVLKSDSSQDIRLCVLKCIGRLLYSAQSQIKSYQNLVLMTLQNRQILPRIEQLCGHDWQVIRQQSREIMSRIQSIRSDSKMECL